MTEVIILVYSRSHDSSGWVCVNRTGYTLRPLTLSKHSLRIKRFKLNVFILFLYFRVDFPQESCNTILNSIGLESFFINTKKVNKRAKTGKKKMLGSTINIHQCLMDWFGSCWFYCLFVGVVNVAFFPYVSSPSCSLAPRSTLGTSILPSREKQHRCHSINGNARVPARCQRPVLNHHFCPQQHYRMEFRFVRLAEVSRALPQLRLPVTVDLE